MKCLFCHVSTQPKHLTCHVSTVKCCFLERLTARSSGAKKCGGSHGGLHGISSDWVRNASTGRSEQTTNGVKFSRTCQVNANRSSTVTVSRRKRSRWMMRKLSYWQPRDNSYPCKVGSKNNRNTWRGSPGRLRRNSSIVWKFYKNGSRLTRNWMQHTPNRSKPSMKCRFWWPNKPQKTRRLSIKALQESSQFHQVPTQTQTRNRPSSQCSNLFSRYKAWGATALRNSSWQLVRQMRKSRRKSVSQIMAQTVRKLKMEVLPENQGSRLSNLRANVVVLDAELPPCIPGFSSMDIEGQEAIRGVCRTQPQKRDIWRRSASKRKMSHNLLCLWYWIRFIAVPFYLMLSRVGEAENPGPVCATAKLFGAKNGAIGQWFAQVGECRQLFAVNASKKIPSPTRHRSVHSTHRHLDRHSLPVSPERDGDLTHTQQFCDYLSLSLFQECERSGGGQHVLSKLHFRVMEGQERSNPFCHHATRGDANTLGRNASWRFPKVW